MPKSSRPKRKPRPRRKLTKAEAGRLGGEAYVKSSTDSERSDSARAAALARWARVPEAARSEVARKLNKSRWPGKA